MLKAVILSQSTVSSLSAAVAEMGKKTESSAFFDNTHYVTTEYCKICTAAPALPILTSTVFLCLAFHHK